MARAKVNHSTDACTITLKGSTASPEPTTCAIKFPGGYTEVSRCSNGDYFVHVKLDSSKNNVESRIDYSFESGRGIENIPDHEEIEHIAVRVKPRFKIETGE